jgi:hypothetical protein
MTSPGTSAWATKSPPALGLGDRHELLYEARPSRHHNAALANVEALKVLRRPEVQRCHARLHVLSLPRRDPTSSAKSTPPTRISGTPAAVLGKSAAFLLPSSRTCAMLFMNNACRRGLHGSPCRTPRPWRTPVHRADDAHVRSGCHERLLVGVVLREVPERAVGVLLHLRAMVHRADDAHVRSGCNLALNDLPLTFGSASQGRRQRRPPLTCSSR